MPVLRRLVSILIIITFIFVVGGYSFYQYALNQPIDLPEPHSLFEIQKGETSNQVLNKLYQQGVLTESDVWCAKLWLKEQAFQGSNIAGEIRAGEFELAGEFTIPTLFELLSSNKQVQYYVTLVEGSDFKQVITVLSESPKLNVTLADKSAQEIMALIPIDQSFKTFHPEGLIFPDTYAYHKGDTDLSILQRAHKRLITVLNDEWNNKASGLPLRSAYEALILASIVEKETGAPSEREQISGVFIRRLQKKMRLQTDPTVIYGLGDRYQGNITRQHLKELTPYNTYRINGLPPTPIALAGREAIHAALNPAPGKALYFVAKGDGTHQFSATIEEHNKAVREYQLKRRSNYRSSPSPTTATN